MNNVQRARHPGFFLGEHISKKNLKQKEFAELIRKSPTEINGIIKGTKDINVDFAVRFSLALGTTPDLRLNMQQQYDIWKTMTSDKKQQEFEAIKNNLSNFSVA